jgi:hypothetical protein
LLLEKLKFQAAAITDLATAVPKYVLVGGLEHF